MSHLASRTVRIFISSTFKDFVLERQLLATQVFPELRRRARERLVEIVEVDLRWGITVDQAERGEVLPICLAEIQRSRPFFVGLLGDRYGWTPGRQHYASALLQVHPWLAEHAGGCSITELEILHGVLKNPAMAGRALFFFRRPSYGADRGPDFSSEKEDERDKLADLKKRIRCSGFPVFEDYQDPAALAPLIREALWTRIVELFPEDAVPDRDARESLRHEAQRRSRLQGYGGRDRVERCLDSELVAASVCLVGASGAGKSAVVAGWIDRQRLVSSEDLHFAFVGCSPESSRASGLVRRFWRWLSGRTGASDGGGAIPDGPPLYQAFALFLGALEPGRRLVWVVDAINQLEGDSTSDLDWLPDPMPSWLRVLVSCLDGRQSEALQNRKFRRVDLPSLEMSERRDLALRHLSVHGRSIREGTLDRLVEDSRMGNPFHLVTVLRELRRVADNDSLPAAIEGVLVGDPQRPEEVLKGLLRRWDDEVQGILKRGLCREVLTLMEASGTGLSELEIREILGISPLDWSYVLGLLEDHLVERSGLLAPGHDLFRAAIRELWMQDRESRRELHGRLAVYFRGDLTSARSLELLLGQLEAIGDWEGVITRLSDIPWVARAVRARGRSDIAGFLDRCPATLQPQARLVEAVRSFSGPGADGLRDALDAAGLLSEVHALDPARLAYRSLVTSARRLGDSALLAACLHALGESEYRRAGHDGYRAAEFALEEALELRRGLAGFSQEEVALTELALGRVMLSWLRFPEAENLLAGAEIALESTAGAADSRVLEAVMLRGIVAYWRHLRGIGRWDSAEPFLLEGVGDLLLIAERHWMRALDKVERGLGKSHAEARRLLHYLQEAPYSVGRFAQALPWLQRLDDLGDSVETVHRYACVTALREVADSAFLSGDREAALSRLAEAENRAVCLTGDASESVARVRRQRARVLSGKGGLDDKWVLPLEELPPQEHHKGLHARWSRVDCSGVWGSGMVVHPWMVDQRACEVLAADAESGVLWRWSSERGWRAGGKFAGGLDGVVLPDWQRGRFLRWIRPRDTVYAAPMEGGSWTIVGEGRHDASGGGPVGWNLGTGRPFQFGGYGYFTYKNWCYEFDSISGQWVMLEDNRPGVSPFPRSGQIVPGDSPDSIYLFSGEGGETGIQREPRARGGLPVASMVGWFTWLRDLWRLDLRTRQWTCILEPNHPSIRQEGAYGFSQTSGWHVLRGGTIPAQVYGDSARKVELMQAWDGSNTTGFQPVEETGEVPPYEPSGIWVAVPNSAMLLWATPGGLWRCELVQGTHEQ